jgi:hypothetical protein
MMYMQEKKNEEVIMHHERWGEGQSEAWKPLNRRVMLGKELTGEAHDGEAIP